MAIFINLETTNDRYVRWASAPIFGVVAMFSVMLFPVLFGIFASIPFLVTHREASITPWLAMDMVLATLWNFWLEKRGIRFRFFWLLPSWLALAGTAACFVVMSLLEFTGIIGPFFR